MGKIHNLNVKIVTVPIWYLRFYLLYIQPTVFIHDIAYPALPALLLQLKHPAYSGLEASLEPGLPTLAA